PQRPTGGTYFLLWHGLLTVPPGWTEGLQSPEETYGRRMWHGQETVPQRACLLSPRWRPGPVSTAAGGDVFFQPGEDFLVPVFAVLRLEDPVALVGEVDEARRHALALERREELTPLADRDAEIEVVLDDEHRRFELAEIGGKAVRRVFL